MYQEISKLLMYGDLPQDEILYKLGQLFEQFEVGEYNKTELVRDIMPRLINMHVHLAGNGKPQKKQQIGRAHV